MARVKIAFPDAPPIFETGIAVRISDVNYGGHVGHDAFLSIMHEARMQWLASHGATELDVMGAALIMADAALVYKGEAFYGDVIDAAIYAGDTTLSGFELLYRFTKMHDGSQKLLLEGKTGMLCFDYAARKIQEMPEALHALLAQAG